MNKKLFTVLLSSFFCIAISSNADAQFWKKDAPHKKRNTVKNVQSKSEIKQGLKQEKREIVYPESIKKERYRIDVLVPLYLDELVINEKVVAKGRLPEKVQASISFYEGVRLAVDTLKKMGYQTDIIVHDITSKGNTVEQLIAKDSLENTDLIIGFVSSLQVNDLAKYAQKKKINFVSAFSPSDANVKDNPYFILINPTLQSNCEAIVDHIAQKYKEEKIFVFCRTSNNLDKAAYEYVQGDSTLNNKVLVNCNTMPDIATMSKLFDTTKSNIILMSIMDNNYAGKLIDKLSVLTNTPFQIYGMPTWKNLTTAKKMNNWGTHITIYLTQPYYFDFTNVAAIDLANKYKIAYGGKPSEISFRAYEITSWMTDLLNKYGAVFNQKTKDNSMAIFTKYDIKPKWDKNNQLFYLENRHLYLYRYQSGIMSIAQ